MCARNPEGALVVLVAGLLLSVGGSAGCRRSDPGDGVPSVAPHGSPASVGHNMPAPPDTSKLAGFLESMSAEPDNATRWEKLSKVGELLAGSEDIDGALAFCNAMEPSFDRRALQSGILRRWALLAPRDAMQWAEALPGELSRGESGRAGAVLTVAEEWARTDPEAAAEWLAGVPGERDRLFLLQGTVMAWAEPDPRVLVSWLEHVSARFPAQVVRGLAVQLAGTWAGSDPEAAMAWASSLVMEQGDRQAVVQAVLRAWARADPLAVLACLSPDALAGLSMATRVDLAGQVARTDLDAAVSLARGLPDDKRLHVLAQCLRTGAQKAPSAAQELFASLPDGPVRESVAGHVAGALMPTAPGIAEFSTGETMGRSADRLTAAFGIGREAQDAYALRSHQGAARARAEGLLADEITPVTAPKRFDALAAEQARLENILQASDGHNLERTLEIAADALRLPAWDADVSKLSGGEKRRVALCKLLLSKPDMLLLDEPTNHLDAESVAWLERFLHEYPGTVVAVTHDRYFLDNVAGWILELDRGHGIPWEGNYSSWLEQKEKRLEQEEKTESARMKAMKAELEWVRSNPKGRHAKSKARLARFNELSSQESQKRNETKELYIPPGPRLGELVIEANHLSKGFSDRLLVEDLSFKLPQGGIVGIIGPNGAGKTTLFRMLTGIEKPDSGELRIGETVEIAYVDQSRDALDSKKTVWEEISDGQDIITVGKYEVNSRAYVSRFNFTGTDQQKRVGDLSGGERNRVHLAKLLKSGGNLLLLDEPTNDLDVETLRALEEALLDFPGCAVVISHDRWFLDRIATHILAFEGDSHVEWFEGNYADYEADRKRRLGEEADQPHRIKYKRLAG